MAFMSAGLPSACPHKIEDARLAAAEFNKNSSLEYGLLTGRNAVFAPSSASPDMPGPESIRMNNRSAAGYLYLWPNGKGREYVIAHIEITGEDASVFGFTVSSDVAESLSVLESFGYTVSRDLAYFEYARIGRYDLWFAQKNSLTILLYAKEGDRRIARMEANLFDI